eukprot:TRINITY_DN68587_c0_g1_i1.p1 TRINITY_DN68587_c0_g1~~TRINITY_DN68587_c0_g1_i1.p1  ORF type:complete len:1221 (+),score=175.31 TRINITY_DN68587_c0_g1_i1:79-3663(+)
MAEEEEEVVGTFASEPAVKRAKLDSEVLSPTAMQLTVPSPQPEWAGVINRVKRAIVAIRVTAVRPFEDSSAGVWHGTGFVVSLANPREALILTNRHIISTGPIRAFATFDEHEELPVWPVYRDPVHDFGLFQFDAASLRFTERAEIPLDPAGLRVGAEVLVIGNDNVEKIQILPATLARVDRNCPEYDDGNYQDENTFYAGAGSNTSGGSSGSPVIDRTGACIALNAGGANEAASAYYLQLDRAVYVLNWLRDHPSEPPLPPRGTLLTRFLFQPFDMLRRLGFTEKQEQQSLEVSNRRPERLKGLLVVESFLPGSEADEKLRPGDVLLEIAGEFCFDFVSLEQCLDARVGGEVPVRVSRAGALVEVTLQVQDLHVLVPHDFVECGGGVFHSLSYHTCKRFHLSALRSGIFVAQSGFGFGWELPDHAVIVAVGGEKVTTLDDFHRAISSVADGGNLEVSWFNPTTNERRQKRSSVRMERTLWPLCMWRFAPQRPNTWHREALRNGPKKDTPPSGGVASSAGNVDRATDNGVSPSAVEAKELSSKHTDCLPSEVEEGAPTGDEEPIGYPLSKDPTIMCVQPMLCTVTTRVAHEFATDFIQSEEERNSTLIRRHGVGLVVDAARGIVLTDRYTVPQPLMLVELTFAQMLTIDAVCVFIHPQHNLVLLRYDPKNVAELPVRAVDLWHVPLAPGADHAASSSAKPSTTSDTGDVGCTPAIKAPHSADVATTNVNMSEDNPGVVAAPASRTDGNYADPSTSQAPPKALEELSIGDELIFVSLHGDHRLSWKKVTVGSVYLKAWAFAEPPAYRERNLEICNMNDTLQGLGGILVEPGPFGRTRAWFAQFPAGKKHYIAGVASQVLTGLLDMIGVGAGSALMPSIKVPALDCEFEEISVAKARRYHGMSSESARELVGCCSHGRRQALMVSRVTAGGECDGQLQEGDVLLRVEGTPVTRPQEVERRMWLSLTAGSVDGTGSGCSSRCEKPQETNGSDYATCIQVLRSKVPVEVRIRPSHCGTDGTNRLLVFNGMVLRPTLRAVAERGGPVLPHARPGQGLYFWYIFPGSPADTFSIAGPGWLVQVNDEPTPSIEALLAVLRSGTLSGCTWLRCRTVDSEGRPTVRALQPDELFWPTVELVRLWENSGNDNLSPRWERVEHSGKLVPTVETAAGEGALGSSGGREAVDAELATPQIGDCDSPW